MKCPKCSSRDIDFQESAGVSICVNCGTVVEENTIVSSIEFQETGDRSHVIGQYVSATCSKPFMSSSRLMGRHLDGRDSRDATLFNARRTISQLASTLKLPQLYIDRAYRLYQLALQRNFIFGRRQAHVSAACLYIICRQEKSPHLLIDFSDALQINVYLLGKAFLHFLKVLNLSLPVVDPSLYIHRYASKLEFGDKMNAVILSALRIISRLKKDWIVIGRRPDGVCAAALLISSRAHGFNVTQENTANLFKIAQDTLRRRLVEFKNTPSAQLNLEEFHVNDLELEFDPPAFINNVVDENDEGVELDLKGSVSIQASDLAKDDVFTSLVDEELMENQSNYQFAIMKLDKKQLKVPIPSSSSRNRADNSTRSSETRSLYEDISDELKTSATSEPVESLRKKARIQRKSSEVKAKDSKRVITVSSEKKDGTSVSDEIVPLTEGESASYLFDDEEKMKRAAIWERTFGSFMEERARKKRDRLRLDENSDKYTQSGKLKKKYARQQSKTTSEAVMSSRSKVKAASKKINYEALKGVFAGDGAFAIPNEFEEPATTSTAITQKPEVEPKPPSKIHFNSVRDQAPTEANLPKREAKADENEEEEDEEVFLYEGEEEDYGYEDEYY